MNYLRHKLKPARAGIWIAFLLWAAVGMAEEIPPISISLEKGEEYQVQGEISAEARDAYQALSDEEREFFLSRRKTFLQAAVPLARYLIPLLFYTQGLQATAAPFIGANQIPILPKENWKIMAWDFFNLFDQVLCEKAQLTMKADSIGAGIAFGAGMGVGSGEQVKGNAVHIFASVDMQVFSNLHQKMKLGIPRFRMGAEIEKLKLAIPYFLSGGSGIRFIIPYVTRSEVKNEVGKVFYPPYGPPLVVTDHTIGLAYTVGFYLPSPWTVLLTTDIRRIHTSPSTLIRAGGNVIRSCAEWVRSFARNRKANSEIPPVE